MKDLGEAEEKEKEEQVKKEQKKEESSKRGFTFDRSKTFFTNLVVMIRSLKEHDKHIELKKAYIQNKNQMDVMEDDLKARYI